MSLSLALTKLVIHESVQVALAEIPPARRLGARYPAFGNVPLDCPEAHTNVGCGFLCPHPLAHNALLIGSRKGLAILPSPSRYALYSSWSLLSSNLSGDDLLSPLTYVKCSLMW